jgi:hypothetical protein
VGVVWVVVVVVVVVGEERRIETGDDSVVAWGTGKSTKA